MQYAIVCDKRVEALPGARGACPTCGAAMLAKCGPRLLHHWAHFGRRQCDPWWENETAWHREWKSHFPEECREVSHIAPDGEVHRADIKTMTGIVIEVQHSNMTDAERSSREAFYKNMVWVIDARGFAQNFDIYHRLPEPGSAIAADIVWAKAKRHHHGANDGVFFLLSECREDYPDITKRDVRFGRVRGMQEVKEAVEAAYRGHHQYDWVRPRQIWLSSSVPVYLDFGGEWLARLETYDESGLQCVRLISRRKFVHDVMNEIDATKIASRFYPIQ